MLCHHTLLDMCLSPGWDDDKKCIDKRVSNIERLKDLSQSDMIKIHVNQDTIDMAYMLAKDILGVSIAKQALRNILDLVNIIDIDSYHIFHQADAILDKSLEINRDNDIDLFEIKFLIVARERTDIIIAHLTNISRFRKIISDNHCFFSDFNIPILNLESFNHDQLFGIDILKKSQNSNMILTYTPQGRIIQLPRGATPLDFAYALHTNMGNRCSMAKVNDSHYPLDKPLYSGDMVEIIKDVNIEPNENWLSCVVTSLAQKSIQRSIKKSNQIKGWHILKQQFGKNVRSYRSKLEYAAQELHCKSTDELALKIASDNVSIEIVQEKFLDYDHANNCCKSTSCAIPFIGIKDRKFKIANCCYPQTCDEIVGISSSLQRPIVIHKSDCLNLRHIDAEHCVSIKWNCDEVQVQLQMYLVNEPDTLRPILNFLAESNIVYNLHSVSPCHNQTTLALVSIIVGSHRNLTSIKVKIQNIPNVIRINIKSIAPKLNDERAEA